MALVRKNERHINTINRLERRRFIIFQMAEIRRKTNVLHNLYMYENGYVSVF